MTKTFALAAIAALALIPTFASSPALAADLSNDYAYADEVAPETAQEADSTHTAAYRDDVTDYTPRNEDWRRNEDWSRNEDWRRRGPRHWGGHDTGFVTARASYASDYLPYHVREGHARRSAIEAWKMKVETIYGPRFSHWRIAMDKNIDCESGPASVSCTANARPVPGHARWSWWRAGRAY